MKVIGWWAWVGVTVGLTATVVILFNRTLETKSEAARCRSQTTYVREELNKCQEKAIAAERNMRSLVADLDEFGKHVDKWRAAIERRKSD